MIVTEQKTAFKHRIIDACIEKQQRLFTDFRDRIETLLEPSGLGNEEEFDNNELSQMSQKTDEVVALNNELRFSLQELETLEQLKKEIHEQLEVLPGAVVVTNDETFFVSVSTENFEVDGKKFIGVSAQSPFYHAMKGKKKGDSFSFNQRSYRITDLY